MLEVVGAIQVTLVVVAIIISTVIRSLLPGIELNCTCTLCKLYPELSRQAYTVTVRHFIALIN